MKSYKHSLWLIICLTQVGCAPGGEDANVRNRLAAIETQLAKVQEDVKQVRDAQRWEDVSKTIGEVAYLTPGEAGYSTVRFDLGVLTAKLDNVQPYANGSKITIKFGNPLSAAVTGLKATLDWGPVDDKGLPIGTATRTKTVTFAQTLPAGAWSAISFALEGVPPENLGFVRVKNVSHTGIQLYIGGTVP